MPYKKGRVKPYANKTKEKIKNNKAEMQTATRKKPKKR
jgi:hypothetical protein